MNVVSMGSGSTQRSSLRWSSALGLAASLPGTGSILLTEPTREPPMRTSLPTTRFAALGTRAFRS